MLDSVIVMVFEALLIVLLVNVCVSLEPITSPDGNDLPKTCDEVNTVELLILNSLPVAKSKCSDDVQESVESTQLNVLSVVPFNVIPPPSADVSVGEAVEPNSIFLSSTVSVVELTVVVVPLTVKLPETIKSFPIVTSLGKPIVIVPELSPTSTSFAVPEKVIVSPKDVAVDVVPSVTVIDELVKLELPILDNVASVPSIVIVLLAVSIVLLVNVSVDDAVI